MERRLTRFVRYLAAHLTVCLSALITLTGSTCAQAKETPVSTIIKSATALWQMSDLQDATGNHTLAAHGNVTLGERLTGAEREASLRRGGDGHVARFDGGYLSLVDDAGLKLRGDQWTIAIRVRDPEGTWLGPILGSYGSDPEVSFALRGVDGRAKPVSDRNLWGGEVPTTESFLFQPGGPRSVQGSPALLEAVWGAQKPNAARVANIRSGQPESSWPNPLQQDTLNAVMRTNVPVGLIGPTDWHDIIVRMTGPKLQLFIDGVLVDEEYPLGETRARTVPFLIGAGHEGGELKTGFRGLMDLVAIWDRPLSGNEVTELSGGREHVRQRELAILGDESPSMQYSHPRGHNRKAGDCIPYWDAATGTFRLYYLILRRNMHSKWDGGHGGLEIWQATTKDLRTWQHHPVTIPISEQWEAWNGTGGVARHNGVYHWFYPTPCYDDPPACGGIQHATSTDGVHFTKTTPHPFLPGGDCEVYEDAHGLFHMLRAGAGRHVEMPALRDKTLVAWVRLADLTQHGGSVLTVEHPDRAQFDGIVFGEAVRGRWMPGSDSFKRTPAGQDKWPVETASPDEVVQMAMVHAGRTVTLYRNGVLYATAEISKQAEFPAGSSAIVGLRHSSAEPQAHSHLRGAVLDARVYGQALSAEQVAALRPGVEGGPKPVAWFDFTGGSLRDRSGTFPDGVLEGDVEIRDGALHVDEGGYFHAPGTVARLERLTSTDLEHWTPVATPFIETDVTNVAMCPHLFRLGDWYYFIGGNQWWRSRGEFGPWTKHQPIQLDNIGVPKTAAFGTGRRIYAGFLPDGGWGGNEILRELVQSKDGWLGTRFVPELVPACGADLAVTFEGAAAGSATGSSVRLAVPGNAGGVSIPKIAGDFRLQLEVTVEPGTQSVTIGLRSDAGGAGGCDLVLSPAARTASFSKMGDSSGHAIPGPTINAVPGMDGTFAVDLIARHDILDAEVAGFRTLTTRFWNPAGDHIRLSVEGGAATFSKIRVRRLSEGYHPYPIAAEPR